MPSGTGPGFEGPQQHFLKKLVPTFIAKTAYREPAAIGRPLVEDDSDLSKWVSERRNEFETQFAAELNSSSKPNHKIRESFDTFFRNTKKKAKGKWESEAAKEFKKIIVQGLAAASKSSPHTTTSSVPAPPPLAGPKDPASKDIPASDTPKLLWSALLKGSIITGRKLFEDEFRGTVSDQINNIRKRDSIHAKMHVGMLNARLKVQWESLQDVERDQWEKKAVELKASERVKLIYRNQAVVRDHISVLLSSLIGPIEEGDHKIGHARFHVLWAFRDPDEDLKTGRLDITGEGFGEAVDYAMFNSDYAANVMKPWRQCSQKTVRRNSPVDKTPGKSVEFDEELRPLLPEVDVNNITSEALRVILSEFLQAHWLWCRSISHNDVDEVPRQIPWMDQNLHVFLSPSFQSILNPTTAKPPALFELYEFLWTTCKPNFQVFSFDHLPSMSTLVAAQNKMPLISTSSVPHDLQSVPLQSTKSVPQLPLNSAAKSSQPFAPSTSPTLLPAQCDVPLTSTSSVPQSTGSMPQLPLSTTTDSSHLLVPSLALQVASTPSPVDCTLPPQSAPLLGGPAPPAPCQQLAEATRNHESTIPITLLPPAALPSQPPVKPSLQGTKRTQPTDFATEGVEGDSTVNKPVRKRQKRTAKPVGPVERRSSRRVVEMKEQVKAAAEPVTPSESNANGATEPVAPSESDANAAGHPIVLNRNGKPYTASKFWSYE